MSFDSFCREHGVLIDQLPPPGRWCRYPTVDHPRSKNGAVKWLGEVGFVQNHATMVDVAAWHPDATAGVIDMVRINAEVARHAERMRAGWARAALRAKDMLASTKTAEHNYLHFKGFGETRGLVLPGGKLLVPMRHWRTNALVGAQVIHWLAEEERYEKKMLPGMRAKGAVLRLGSPKAPRTWLVEGYATGLSVAAAVRLLNLRDAVLICFSAGNLIHVAEQLGAGCAVFADNDASGAGLRAAQATGRPYCLSQVGGEDANDMHMRAGLFEVARLLMGCGTETGRVDFVP